MINVKLYIIKIISIIFYYLELLMNNVKYVQIIKNYYRFNVVNIHVGIIYVILVYLHILNKFIINNIIV